MKLSYYVMQCMECRQQERLWRVVRMQRMETEWLCETTRRTQTANLYFMQHALYGKNN